MVTAAGPEPATIVTHGEVEPTATDASATPQKSVERVNICLIPTEEEVDDELISQTACRSTFHIYQKHEMHKCISPLTDPTKERWSGPTAKENKARRKEKKERKNVGLPTVEPDDNAFFLHRPYLAFHIPPQVLYLGSSKRTAKPAVLIHTRCFWREYKLQLGPSIAKPGVLDPRGVIAWKHHGGDKKALKLDGKKLKGYKVRTWRLWCETGKDYVHSVKQIRDSGRGHDPDVPMPLALVTTPERPVVADEVVYLRWTSPLSRHARRYHFQYAGIDFYWKGTGTVKESRMCGMFLRFNHLKLVAKLPNTCDEKEKNRPEVCLGKYTSSIAGKKNGTLDFFDTAILCLVEEHAPYLLVEDSFDEQIDADEVGDQSAKIARMKKSTLYQVMVATAMCMIMSEKEKRHTLLDILINAGEGGGGAGG